MTTELRALRKAARLSQGDLAELIGTQVSQISRWERGNRPIPKVWAERLAPHLGVTWWELLGAPGSGFADAGTALAPPPGPRMLPEITASDPRDDLGYAELADAAEAMLAEEGEALSPRRFADLIHRLWQDFLDHPEDEPLTQRVAAVIEQRRRMIRAARSLALGPGRRI